MSRNKGNTGYGTVRLCLWSLGYARRRWPAFVGVLAALLLKVGLDVLKPWPMKLLIDYVLKDLPMPPAIARGMELLPGAGTREGLLTWCVAGTVLTFLLGWAFGLAGSLANIGFGQRMVY